LRLAIVGGAGLLGSTTAFKVALDNIINEIILIDVKENLVRAFCFVPFF
jgi:malate/lactate dehydrogenase